MAAICLVTRQMAAIMQLKKLADYFSFNIILILMTDSGVLEGAQLRTVTFPVKKITSCCFGGPNYSELYITSARFGLTEEDVRSRQPLAGSVFKVTGLGVCGFAAPTYKG